MAKTSKINKIREVTTPAGLVLTGNIIAGKTTTNLILNDINERSSARRQGVVKLVIVVLIKALII